MLPLVQVKNLCISFIQEHENTPAVKNISFEIPRGKITALIGESGSGKSVTALSLMQLLSSSASVKGEILFSEAGNAAVDLLLFSKEKIRQFRGNKIAMIFQEPMTSLNPVHTCGAQVIESLMLHKKLSKQKAKEETIALFKKVELPQPEKMLKRYPHELSGGQKQRVMIAMAMSCGPALLIADEPTTALDVRVQKNILGLIKKLQQETGMSVLLITHDLALVADTADEMAVMYRGEIVESGGAQKVLAAPAHSYTRALMNCRPAVHEKGKKLPVIGGKDVEEKSTLVSTNGTSTISEETILSVQHLTVSFPTEKNIFGKIKESYKAVNDVSFDVKKNETVGLVGESGCGKTTLGRAVLQLIYPDAGKIILNGRDLARCSAAELRVMRKDLQVVFQDPYGSLNPRLSIGEAIIEPMKVYFRARSKYERKERAAELLEKVNMNADMMNRYPHQFSGGQRQRICIARALALNPEFLIFDESVSALDVSVQAQILNLITDLKSSYGFSSIFISHDLSVIRYISDRVMVMQEGRIVETGTPDDIFLSPKENYTKELLAAIPGAGFLN